MDGEIHITDITGLPRWFCDVLCVSTCPGKGLKALYVKRHKRNGLSKRSKCKSWALSFTCFTLFHCPIQLSWCTQRTGLTAQGDVEVSAVSKDTELTTDRKLTSEDLSATVQASCWTIDFTAASQ